MWAQFDVSIFRWFNSWAGVSRFFDLAIIFRAEYLFYIFLIAVLCFPLITVFPRFRALRRKNIELLVFAVFSGLIARFFFAEVVRFFYNRPRPFEVLSGVHQLLQHEQGSSFPSGHASFAFAVAVAVAWYYPKTSILFFLAAISIGIGRISAGVHWPSDIFGGAVVGILSACVVQLLWRRLLK